jgi:signal transduction histidine kinase
MGLKNIQSRIRGFSGEMIIDSGQGEGTTITIQIPI